MTTNTIASKLSGANETTWLRLGSVSELLHDPEKAIYSYENALRHNPYNVKALTQLASICRLREQYPKAVEYFQRILNIENSNGEIWGALGHCYLMMDDLQKAYTAYQQALYHLPNPKDPNLWYGIGILYDRYGSFEHAEEAFTAVLKMDSKFEKSNEIYFRLGIIYKQQTKYEQALECFRYILQKPPRPLTQGDIYFQIGHVFELQKDFTAAKDAYERVLKETPNHAKALQQLGWLYHSNPTLGNQDVAISYLMRSIDSDPGDGQTWYLIGRCYMAQQQYRKAYDAYQQAVYRDGRNPTFWCSIGVLYYQINQYRDALDAYSRAIRLNPYLSEVWYDLGTLYESCNQIQDSLDAYQRAAELDPTNKHIQSRLATLRTIQAGGKPEEAENNREIYEGERAAPRTLEPRAAHMTGAGEPSRGRMSQNIPASVPDLVDLSDSDKSRTLPSANDLRAKEAQKSRENLANSEERPREEIPQLSSHQPQLLPQPSHQPQLEHKPTQPENTATPPPPPVTASTSNNYKKNNDGYVSEEIKDQEESGSMEIVEDENLEESKTNPIRKSLSYEPPREKASQTAKPSSDSEMERKPEHTGKFASIMNHSDTIRNGESESGLSTAPESKSENEQSSHDDKPDKNEVQEEDNGKPLKRSNREESESESEGEKEIRDSDSGEDRKEKKRKV